LGGELARAKYFEKGEWKSAGVDLPDYSRNGTRLDASDVAKLIRAECGYIGGGTGRCKLCSMA
jgi:hypothetical protein